MDCDSCRMLLFLKTNGCFWENPTLFNEIMLEARLAANENGVVQIEASDADGFDDDN